MADKITKLSQAMNPVSGLTLRDYFAACALANSVDIPGYDNDQKKRNKIVAKACYEQADAMLEARGK